MANRGSIYIASTLSNAERVKQLSTTFENNDVRITYKWFEHGLLTDKEDLKRALKGEMDGVRKADLLVLVTPAKVGSGIEFGIAWSHRIPIMVLLEGNPEFKPFYLLPGVTTFETAKELIPAVLNYLDNADVSFT